MSGWSVSLTCVHAREYRMEKEKNLLTEELLLAGYSAENYPAYVQIPSGSFGTDVLENLYGGFEFRRDYLDRNSYQTGCGLFARAESCISAMGHMGIDWCFENDNAVLKCPYRKTGCEKNHPALAGMEPAFYFCACHMTDHYEYENSVERIIKEQEQKKGQAYEAFAAERQGRICEHHMYYDDAKKKWEFRYDPVKCAKVCIGGFCPVRSRMLASEKGNIFYDVRVSTKRKDGTLFDGEPIVGVIKGKKFLKRPVSMDVCCAAVPKCGEEIFKREWWNGYSMRKLYDPDLEIAIINIRAGRKEGRDLEQDLEDIKNGIAIVHESDQIKAQKERKQERKQKRLEALKRKIRKKGYAGLNDAERRLADKRIGAEEIKALEQERRQEKKEEQLSLSMWMEL